MHSQDLHQPCYSQCIFSPYSASLAVPSSRFVVQSSKPPPPPPGAPPGVKVGPAPANYLAEFTIGPYLYWATLHADSTARARFEEGVKRYYATERGQLVLDRSGMAAAAVSRRWTWVRKTLPLRYRLLRRLFRQCLNSSCACRLVQKCVCKSIPGVRA